jgi:CheY-like chemotaxis protein
MLLQRKNIFLADDDSDDVTFFSEAINEICSACNLTVFCNGYELVKLIKEGNASTPDIIFLDVNMPKINGLEALAFIRTIEAYEAVPVIIYSTSASFNHITLARDTGANHYFIKPSDYVSLREQIKKLLDTDWQTYKMPEQLEEFVLQA